MILNEKIPNITGQLFLKIFKNNKFYDEILLKNTVLNSGKTLISNLLVGNDVTNKKISKIGIGDSDIANNVTMTGLQGTVTYFKNITSFIFPAFNQVEISFIFNQGEANGINVKEFGLFSADLLIFNRVIWPGSAFIKTSDFALEGKFLISIS